MERKAVLWFVALSFALAWPLFVVPLALGGVAAPVRQSAALAAWSTAMWAPGIAALVVTRFVLKQPLGTLNLRRLGPKRMYLWAWFLPPILVIAAMLLTLLLGAGRLDLEFTLLRAAMEAWGEAEALPPALVATLQIVLAFTIAPFINVAFALGEELGWRGFLLPRLLPHGQARAIVLSGAIWGIWHAPAILQGHNYPTQPVLGVMLMVVFCIVTGVIFSWLYLRTQSPWAPAHGSLNASAGLPLLFLVDFDTAIGGTLPSVIGWIPLAAFVVWLVLSRRLPAPTAGSTVPPMVDGGCIKRPLLAPS